MAVRIGRCKKWISVLSSVLILCLLGGCQYDVDEEEQQDRITAENDSTGEPAIESAMEDVISAYAEYLQQYCETCDSYAAEHFRFSLVYIDEDQIPELAVIVDESHPSGVQIYVYRDGAVVFIDEFGSFGAFSFSPCQNIIYSGFSNMGDHFIGIFCIEGNESKELQHFHTYTQYYDENFEIEQDIYELDGETVSEEAYNDAYDKWKIDEMVSLTYRSNACFSFTDKESAYGQMIMLLPET